MKNKFTHLSHYLDLLKEIHPTKNSSIDPSQIKRGSGKKIWWQCIKGHEWEAPILARTTKKTGCPYCSGRNATKETCLSTVNPVLASQWSEKNEITPDEILPSSGKKFWWKCKIGHEWESTVDKRTQGRGCPYCSRKKASDEINLEKLYPEIASEWNYKKNGDLKPSMVLPKSTKELWWVCPKGHEYQSIVHYRTSGNHGCNICSGHIINQTNCLSTLFPEIALEWHPTKNAGLKSENISGKSLEKVWWKCKNFSHHEWCTTVISRTGFMKTNCPFCKSSKGEKLIENWLLENKYAFTRQFKFNNCKHKQKLPFDFAIFNPCIKLIEFNGIQHYEPVKAWGGELKFKERIKLDLIKKDFCSKMNIELLVIPYWDKENIFEILEKWF